MRRHRRTLARNLVSIPFLVFQVQSARDEWEGESTVEQTDLLPSANDTNILIAAITQGSGLRKRPESSRSSGGSSRSKNYNQTNNRATAVR